MDKSLLDGWENFYVIVGSAAGGLTGLTFVVIALIQDAARVNPAGLRAFVTPTIVHFCAVLALAAYLSMPHQHIDTLGAGFGLAGLAGVVYGGFIARNMHRHRPTYAPVGEDWIWNVIVPTLAYALLATMAVLIWRWPAQSLYGVAVVTLLLLFIGIHNAWDIAVWMTTVHRKGESSDK
jgi:hypothetical protein